MSWQLALSVSNDASFLTAEISKLITVCRLHFETVLEDWLIVLSDYLLMKAG